MTFDCVYVGCWGKTDKLLCSDHDNPLDAEIARKTLIGNAEKQAAEREALIKENEYNEDRKNEYHGCINKCLEKLENAVKECHSLETMLEEIKKVIGDLEDA